MKILKVELNVLTNNPVDDNKMSQILQNTSLLDYEIILQKESKGNWDFATKIFKDVR